MDPAEALKNVREAFRDFARPEGLFIYGTCRCEECEEHNQTLSSHTPENITLEELGNPGWDPMCMASDAAFAYYLPGMVRLAFEDSYYIYQLVFHLCLPSRLGNIGRAQAGALLIALRTWDEKNAGSKEEDCYRHDLDAAIKRLGSMAE